MNQDEAVKIVVYENNLFFLHKDKPADMSHIVGPCQFRKFNDFIDLARNRL